MLSRVVRRRAGASSPGPTPSSGSACRRTHTPAGPPRGGVVGWRAPCSSRPVTLLRWGAGGGLVEASEDLERSGRVRHGSHHHLFPTPGTSEAIHPEDMPEQVTPGPPPARRPGRIVAPPLGQSPTAGFRLGSAGDHLVTPRSTWREDPVIEHHVGMRWRHQRSQPLDQLEIGEPQTRCPVGSRPLEPQHHSAPRRGLDAALGQRGAADIPAQPLDGLCVMPAHHDVRTLPTHLPPKPAIA